MAKLRVHNLCMSVDGYVAGPDQSRDNPLGVGGEGLHEWIFVTRGWRQMLGEEGGEEGIDNDFFVRGDENIGATIMGRNMFGPIRGEWPDDEWKGWWGPNPPYHHPVFVLTHHPRPPIPMEGGTTFHFVSDGIESALEQAFAAAGGKDVRLGGGASAVQQYLRAGLIDDLHVPIVPVLLGGGERLFDNLDGGPAGYEVVEYVNSPAVAHVRLAPTGG
jgi:dihydrofolate reductase